MDAGETGELEMGDGGVGGWYHPCVFAVLYELYWFQYWLKSVASKLESLFIGEAENSLFMITGGDTVDGYWGLVLDGKSEVVLLVYSGGV